MAGTNDSNNRERTRKRGNYFTYLSDPSTPIPRSTRRRWTSSDDVDQSTSDTTTTDRNFQHHRQVYTQQVVGQVDLSCDIQRNQGTTASSPDSVDDLSDDVTQFPIFESEIESTDTIKLECTGETEDTSMDDSSSDLAHQKWDNYLDDYTADDDERYSDSCQYNSDNAELSRESQDTDEGDKPLYPGAPLTVGVSILLVISFAVRHHLTGEALSDLLTLIELHCILPNLCRKSLKLFHAFFKELKSPIERHYYCLNCYGYIGKTVGDQCPICSKSTAEKISTSYFIVLPVLSQLQSIISRSGALEKLRHRSKRKKQLDGNINDVYDGSLYKKHFNDEGFFHGTSCNQQKSELHLSFQMNFDGVSLFRSSKFSVWPVYYTINELPPSDRFQRRNRIYAGIWFGFKKPDCGTFLKPFAVSFKEMYDKGFLLQDPVKEETLTVRAILLSALFDAPARCMFMECNQFNGMFGCPYCLSPGETVKTSARGHTRVYPFNRENPATGHAEERTHESTIDFARQAHNMRKTGKSSAVMGVKNITWFLFVPKFDIINGIGSDYMHCVCLGIMKMLLTLWTDKSHKEESWYIGSKLHILDKNLLSIKPPYMITRAPRALSGELSHWKASEFRSFLLYYSVPLLWKLLPTEFFQHYCLLVEAIYVLLQSSVSSADLTRASGLLKHFSFKIESLYSKRYQTSNMHMLLHLVQRVKCLGPLWAMSCFFYEDCNGELRDLCHGTQSIQEQIVTAVCIQQQIPSLERSLTSGSSAENFYEKLTSGRRIGKNKCDIGNDCQIVGAIVKAQISHSERLCIERKLGHVKNACKIKRIAVKGSVIHSKEYKPVTRRNSYTVQFMKQSGEVSYGQVRYYAKCKLVCPNELFVYRSMFLSETCICRHDRQVQSQA